jgi:polar amino acid transport system substrate-binding protein
MSRILISLFILTMLWTGGAEAQQLTIYTEEFPPFNFTEKGKITGVSSEVVQGVMASTGMRYKIKSLPWAQTYDLAQKERNALIFSISRNPKREKLFKWIGIVTPTTYSVMALKSRSDIKINKLPDMSQYKIGTTKGDIVEVWLLDKGFALSDLVRASGDHAALINFKNLLGKRIDVCPFPDAVAFHIARQQGHSNPELLLQRAFPIEELSGGYYIAAGLNTSNSVVSTVSAALAQFKQTDDYFKILAHWGVDAMGMKTDAPIAKLIYALKNFNRISTVGYLATDKLSAHRHGGLYRKEMREQFVEAYARTFKQWQKQYEEMQGKVDAMLIGDISGIKNWDHEAAKRIAETRTKIPTGCVKSSLADYAMFAYEGGDFIINRRVAENLGQSIPKSYLVKATKIIE